MKKIFQFPILRLRILSLVGILILAGVLRLYRIQDYMTFLGDEGRDVLVVYNILHGHLTLLGPTASVGGFFLGPIYYYFMAPFLWIFGYNPVGPAVMVAFFGIATVWLVYKAGSKFFNEGTGIIAALLYGISPLVIAYSRSSWNPNIMPFFSLLTIYMIYKAISKNNIKFFVVSGFFLGVAMQLHYLATFLGVVIVAYVLFTRILLYGFVQGASLLRTTGNILRDYLFIVLGFIVGWSPFLAFEVRHGFPNIQSIIRFVFSSGHTGGNNHFFAIIGDVFFRLFGRLLTDFPPPEQVSLNAHFTIVAWYCATLILGITSVIILFFQWAKLRRQSFGIFTPQFLLFLWLVFGVGLFAFYKKPIYDYYFGFMFPLPFFLVGNTLSFFWERNRIFRIISIASLLSLLIINLSGIPFRYPPNRQLNQAETISRFVLSKTNNKSFNFALITSSNSDYAYRYFFTLWNHTPVTIENSQVDPKRATVTGQLLVVCESLPCHPLGNSLWEIAGFGRAEIVGEWNVSVVKVYRLMHYKQL